MKLSYLTEKRDAGIIDILREAVKQGWRVEKTASGHFKAIPPDPKQRLVIVGGNASDPRAIKNVIAQMRRSGFIWPPL